MRCELCLFEQRRVALFCQHVSNRFQQDFRCLTFREEPVYEFKAVRFLHSRRDDKNRDLGLQRFHLSGNLRSRLAAEKMIRDDQLDGILPEDLKAIFS